jgi:exosome complex RNA-binding protein Rrp4
MYRVTGNEKTWWFKRRVLPDGRKSKFYTFDVGVNRTVALTTTVAANLRRLTIREQGQVRAAVRLSECLGNPPASSLIEALKGGILDCSVTAADVQNMQSTYGKSLATAKGGTTKHASVATTLELVPRLVQVQQTLSVDIFFVRGLDFLLGVMSPLGLLMCVFLKDRSAKLVAKGIRGFLDCAAERNFDVLSVRSDGEGGVYSMRSELQTYGIVLDPAGPGQHVPVVERAIRTIKERVRGYVNTLCFEFPRALTIGCVHFCVRSLNLVANSTFADRTSPYEQYSGVKLNAKRDLRVSFGDYCQCTVANTDNTMAARTESMIALVPSGNTTGSVYFLSLGSYQVVTRDQFVVLPAPDEVCRFLTARAAKEGYFPGRDDPIRTADDGEISVQPEDDDSIGLSHAVTGSSASVENVDAAAVSSQPRRLDMMPIDGRPDSVVAVRPEGFEAIPPGAGVMVDSTESVAKVYQLPDLRRSTRATAGRPAVRFGDDETRPATAAEIAAADLAQSGRVNSADLSSADKEAIFVARIAKERYDAETRRELRRQIRLRSHWRDSPFVLQMSVRAALRERGVEARPVIMAELRQMVEKKVWHAVDVRGLTGPQKRAIIRSTMFLKDKFLASGAFEKFKARLVAGGDQQDKLLYEDLSSPTAATASVLAVATMGSSEGRYVLVMDIGGAFLEADMAPTGVIVHMRLDRIMTEILVGIEPSYKAFVEPSGCLVVALDKALYGCVEASALWYANLRSALMADGFVENPYDPCVFNKTGEDGLQITIALHVDDLLVTSCSKKGLADFVAYLKRTYKEVKVNHGPVVDYVGMTFDFRVEGEVSITMQSCVDDILSGSGVTDVKVTPATSHLFDVRSDVTKATATEEKFFRSYVAKVLYLAKRVRPECLTAVAFLTTRVNECDQDDLNKLQRLLGYILGTRERGITLRVGESMTVRAYIDAAYGVHTSSGKSHTGCAIVLGDAGPVYCKSAKQKIVTKSSTEAELVGLSDTASQALHLRNFVIAQGYETGPAVIYQDNLSCMSLMKRGGPSSERSRHIAIRHFWLCEKVAEKEVVIEHLSTEMMVANVLTKPVQGAQFERERQGLTNWSGAKSSPRGVLCFSDKW